MNYELAYALVIGDALTWTPINRTFNGKDELTLAISRIMDMYINVPNIAFRVTQKAA